MTAGAHTSCPFAENVRAAYESYVKTYPARLEISVTGIGSVLGELAVKEPKAKSVAPEQMVDRSLLDELERDGFFAKLLGPKT